MTRKDLFYLTKPEKGGGRISVGQYGSKGHFLMSGKELLETAKRIRTALDGSSSELLQGVHGGEEFHVYYVDGGVISIRSLFPLEEGLRNLAHYVRSEDRPCFAGVQLTHQDEEGLRKLAKKFSLPFDVSKVIDRNSD